MIIPVTTATTVQSSQIKFEKVLVRWIVETSKPSHTVEHKSIRDKFSVASSHFSVPGRRTILRRVLEIADIL